MWKYYARRRQPAILVAVFLLFASSVRGNELPEAPVPKIVAATPVVQKRKVVNTEFKLEAGLVALAWAADTISTHRAWQRNPGCYEIGGFFNGTRDEAKIAGALAGLDAAMLFGSYEWKKRIHNKWLNPLWRIPISIRIEAHTRAAIHNSLL